MKTRLLTFFAMSLLVVLPMKAITSSKFLQTEDNEDIELKGDVEDDRKKSLSPFRAYQTDNLGVCIMSYETHPSVTIRIIDSIGVTMDVLSSSLTPQQVVSFDISSYPHGTYTLVISTPQGTYLTGVFEVE